MDRAAARILERLHAAQGELYAGGDAESVRAVLTADVEWHVPGGNYLLRVDGRVSFLDYGACKVMTRDYREDQIELVRVYLAGDRLALRDAMARMGFVPEPAAVDPDVLWRAVELNSAWVMRDAVVRLDADGVRERVEEVADPRSPVFRLMLRMNLPAEELWFRRLDMGIIAVLAQLRAEGNWHRMAREWWFGDRPETDLGRAERAWREARRTPPWRVPGPRPTAARGDRSRAPPG